MFAVSASIQTKPAAPAVPVVVTPMVLQMDTTALNVTITLPMDGVVTVNVDWGDGSPVEVITTDNPTHVLKTRGSHTISISGDGTVGHFGTANDPTGTGAPFVPNPDADKLKSVTSFGTFAPTSWEGAFRGCANLGTVAKAGAVNTQNCTDMSRMFNGCLALTALDVSGFDTAQVTDMNNMFFSCKVLTALDVTGFDTRNVTDMTNMFYNCELLTTLDVSGFDTAKCTGMGGMFGNCKVLTPLDVSNFDTSNVTNMKRMFYRCYLITALDVSGFDTTQVTNMNYMFADCRALTALDVTRFDTAQVTDMSYMFYANMLVTTLDVTGFVTDKVTDMTNMFYGCGKLATLDVTSFNTSQVTDMYRMFRGCKTLTTLDVSSFDTSKVTKIAEMFHSCGTFSVDISGFTIASLESPGGTTGIFESAYWPSAEYQKMLNAWSAQAVIPVGINFNVGAGGAKYGAAKPARDILTNPPNNWNIRDGGA